MVVVQAIGTRIKLAHALAQQWFGIFITPDSPADGRLIFYSSQMGLEICQLKHSYSFLFFMTKIGNGNVGVASFWRLYHTCRNFVECPKVEIVADLIVCLPYAYSLYSKACCAAYLLCRRYHFMKNLRV